MRAFYIARTHVHTAEKAYLVFFLSLFYVSRKSALSLRKKYTDYAHSRKDRHGEVKNTVLFSSFSLPAIFFLA